MFCKMSTMIFVARDGETIGEHAETLFAAKVRSGEIRPSDHFWTEGMVDWKTVAEYEPPRSRPQTVKITRKLHRTGPIRMDASPGQAGFLQKIRQRWLGK